MPKNKELYDAIVGAALAGKTDVERNAPLDALLAVDPSKPEEFRKAITSNRAFWEGLDGTIKPDGIGLWAGVAPRFLGGGEADDYLRNDTFLKHDDATYNFQKIQQAAAEQRVKLGLKKDTDANTLINILKYNTEACRAYLGTIEPKIAGPKWIASEKPPALVTGEQPPDINKSKDVLTDEAVNNIQKQASNLLIAQLISKVEEKDRALLVNLIAAKDNPEQLKIALEAMNFPTLTSLPQALSVELARLATDREDSLMNLAALSELNHQLEVELNEEAILGLVNTLKEENPVTFLNKLLMKEPFTSLPNKARITDASKADPGAEAKKILSAQYLKAALLKVPLNPDQLKTALNAPDQAQLVAALKVIVNKPDQNHIIEQAVTDVNLWFKAALVTNFIRQIPDVAVLKALEDAESEEAFNAKLQELTGADKVDYMVRGVLEREIRLKHFELEVEEASSLKGVSRPALMAAFGRLDATKQQEILNKPKNLPIIINAQSEELIKHYFGEGNFGVAVAENQRIAAFKAIHNSAIAGVLASFKPPIALSPQQIEAINLELSEENLDLADKDEYKGMLDVLFAECKVHADHEKEFYAAFNFDKDGDDLTADPKDIREQFGYNEELHNRYRKAHNVLSRLTPDAIEKDEDASTALIEKMLLDVLLRVQKKAKLTDDQFDEAYEQLSQSTSVDDFLDKWLAGVTIQKHLKKALSTEFSPAEFRKIKNEVMKHTFIHEPDDSKLEAAGVVRDELKAIQRSTASIIKHSKELEFIQIQQVDELAHLYNPLFQVNAKKDTGEMLKTYQELSKECDVIVEHLARTLTTLKARLDNMPVPPVLLSPPNSQAEIKEREKTRKELLALHKELEGEIQKLDEKLTFYKEVQFKLSDPEHGILTAIRAAVTGSKKYIYDSDTVTAHLVDRNDVGTAAFQTKAAVAYTAVYTHGQPLIQGPFSAKEKPTEDQVYRFDVVANKMSKPQNATATSAAVPSKPVAIEAHFTYDAHPKDVAPIVVKGADTKQVTPGKIEITKWPEQPEPPAPQISEVDLAEARLNLSMLAASQALSTMNGPPSKERPLVILGVSGKEEQLKYLWTALVVLGENNPKMKFSPDAIKIVGGAKFNPENERKTTLGVDRGFSHDSFYAKRFNVPNVPMARELKETMDKRVEEAVALCEKRSDKKTRQAVDKHVENAATLFKGKLAESKKADIVTDVEKHRDLEGPTFP